MAGKIKKAVQAFKQIFVKAEESPGKLVPKMLRTPQQRNDFAQKICIQLDTCIAAYGDLGDRVTRNEQLYRNEGGITSVNFGPDADLINYPVTQPKIDGTVGDIFLAITGLNPYVQAIALNRKQDAGDRIQADLQLLADRGKFDMALWEWLKNALISGVGVIRPTFELINPSFLPSVNGTVVGLTPGKEFGCIEFSVIHISDFMPYPHNMRRIPRMVSNIVRLPDMRIAEVMELQKADAYFSDVEDFAGMDNLADIYPHGRDRNYDLTGSFYTVEYKDKSVDRYEFITKADLDHEEGDPNYQESYWYGVLDKTSRRLLDIQKYDYTVPWYHEMRFDVEQGSWYPSGSMAQNLQGLQIALNDTMNTLKYGNLSAAFTGFIVPRGTFKNKKVRFNPGDILETDQDTSQILPIHNQFNAGQMQWLVEKILDWVDSVARKSQLATGQQLKSGATATEAHALMMGDQAAQSQFIRFASEAIENVWAFMFELYCKHYKQIKATFGDALQATPDDLKGFYRFEVNGKTQGNTPQALLGKLQAADQIAQRPTSQYDPQKVEAAIMKSLQLPFNESALLKDYPALVEAFLADPEKVQALLQNPQVQQGIMQLVQQGAQQLAPQMAMDIIKQEIESGATADQSGLGAVQGLPGMEGGGPPPIGAPGAGPNANGVMH